MRREDAVRDKALRPSSSSSSSAPKPNEVKTKDSKIDGDDASATKTPAGPIGKT